MDTRIKEEDDAKYIEEVKKITSDPQSEESEILITEQDITRNPKFLESIIFNLVQKTNLKSYLENQYNQHLVQQKTYPDFAKYYIHIPYMLPIIATTLGYMKYKKVLNINNAGFILCAASFMNEFARYKRTLGMDQKKAEEYAEHSDNYSYLLRKYTNSTSGLLIFKYVFGIDIENANKNISESYLNDEQNKEFLTLNYI